MLKAIIFFLEIKQSFNQKIEDFVKKIFAKNNILLSKIAVKFNQSLGSDYFFKIVLFFIISLSIFSKTSKDLGHDSFFYLMAAQQFFDNFNLQNINNISFLALSINFIPAFIAKILAIDYLIAINLIVILTGIVSIFSCQKILKKSKAKIGKNYINILLISFAFGYFLPIFTSSYNEISTEFCYFLALIYPYLCLNIIHKNFDDNRKINFTSALIGGVAICLKPIFFVIIIFCELYQILSKNTNLRNFLIKFLATLSPVIIYNILIFALFRENIFWQQFLSEIYNFSISNFDEIAKNYLTLPLIFTIINFEKIKKDKILELIFYCFLGAVFTSFNMNYQNFNQISLIFSLQIPLLIIVFYDFILDNKNNQLKKYWLIILIVILASIFNPIETIKIVNNLIYFWWILILIAFIKNEKNKNSLDLPKFLLLSSTNNPTKSNLTKILLIFFIIFLFYQTIILSNFIEISWLVNFILAIYAITIYQNLVANKTIKINIIINFLAFFSFIGLIINDLKLDQNNIASFLKTPNEVTDQIISSNKSKELSKILIISQTNYGKNLINKTNNYASSLIINYDILFENIKTLRKDQEKIDDKINELINYINKNDINYLVFQTKDPMVKDFCSISFLEFYLQNHKFRKFFVKNYYFNNRISIFLDKKKPDIARNKIANNEQDNSKTILEDYEIYLRK